MKRLALFAILSLVLLLICGCAASRRITESSDIERQDSIRIEYRERIVSVPDTVFVEIPAQTAERTTLDSTSHLENDYAESDARINSDGTLFHSLDTKQQKKPVPTEKQIEYRDSIVYRDRIKTETVTETEYVERSLSWWERTQIYGFWAALLVIAITYRKNILPFLKRVLSML